MNSAIYTQFIDALADAFRETFTDHNDDPDSLLYGRPVFGDLGGGSTEASFLVVPDHDELDYLVRGGADPAPLTADELAELRGYQFIVRVQLLE